MNNPQINSPRRFAQVFTLLDEARDRSLIYALLLGHLITVASPDEWETAMREAKELAGRVRS